MTLNIILFISFVPLKYSYKPSSTQKAKYTEFARQQLLINSIITVKINQQVDDDLLLTIKHA